MFTELAHEVKTIYEYHDYRPFLRDYYEEKKAASGFTYRDFAKCAGMNSSSWLLHLIKGSKNLSSRSAPKAASAMKLNKSETKYFEALVRFTQARDSEERDRFFRILLGLKRKLKISRIAGDQYEYYSKWHHPVIRSLVSKVDFGGGGGNHDFSRLGRCLIPPIPAREARKSVRLLEKLGFIALGEDGRYTQTQAAVSTGDEVTSLSVINYHKQVSRLAEGIHDHSAKAERDISALTLGIGEKDFLRIKARIQAFRKEIMELAAASESPDRVYQLNFQFFPVGRAENP